MENNGDVDVAVISKISPGFDITVCGGIKITEHTQAFIEEQLKELSGESNLSERESGKLMTLTS